MGEQLKHECGIVLIRLRKPLAYYAEKYGTASYGLNKLYLLMEKQHNRGQEAAGMACVKLDAPSGSEYIFRSRALGARAIGDVFDEVNGAVKAAADDGVPVAERPFMGELYIGHLRYSTTGRSGISYTHPFLRRNNWRARNLCLAGNFNLTNVDEILAGIVSEGQHPRHNADTFIILEQLGAMLDRQAEGLYRRFEAEGCSGQECNARVEDALDLACIIRDASESWDGGFAIVGATGSGDSFIFRDRWGIRPAHYYEDDEIFVAASERAVIQTVMGIEACDVKELAPGEGIIIKRNGTVARTQVLEPHNPRPCSFERIYFSRGTDGDIYRERKQLGYLLTGPILEAVDHDIDHTVFSFIPNTAEVAFYGMLKGLRDHANRRNAQQIAALVQPSAEEIEAILAHRVRSEKLAVKDIKLRTFIAEGSSRDDLVSHVYDVTYGTITPGEDTIVVIDDSIVRGTTLRQSILRSLARLHPRRIVVVSSSPQVRYPDCYGIDISRIGEFVAFNAAVALLRESGRQWVLDEVYRKCKAQQWKPKEQIVNHVKEVYAPFTDCEVADKIARMITPAECQCEVKLVFQSIEGLHRACPDYGGDWYFSGDYPTPGGNLMVNNAFINWYEGEADKR